MIDFIVDFKGDNVLTAISVAKECGIIDLSKHVYIPNLYDSLLEYHIAWTEIDLDYLTLDPLTLKPLSDPINLTTDYDLAITGDVFRHIQLHQPQLLPYLLKKTQVYARMSPDEKHLLVEMMQSYGMCVAFVGDGANDCGALKSADCGLSLSDAEASVAAPFTSQESELDCVLRLIREGRYQRCH